MITWILSLFGLNPGQSDSNTWRVSKNGNPTRIVNEYRITVFENDEGWVFCAADSAISDDDDPYFSDAYETKEIAQIEAMAFSLGEPSTYKSIKQKRRETRESQEVEAWISSLDEIYLEVCAAKDFISGDESKITTLRKPERRLKSIVKALDWQIPKYRLMGIEKNEIDRASQILAEANFFLTEIVKRIEYIKSEKSNKKIK